MFVLLFGSQLELSRIASRVRRVTTGAAREDEETRRDEIPPG